jgi:hypothetical protein
MPRQDTRNNGGRQRTAPTRLCACAQATICVGLDGALSAPSARPVGQAVQGFVAELLVRASRPCNDGTAE